ncbi:MAG: hypothetical protein HZB14_07465 [Actinobacteria bacterium]|nr:hypothetical protein [Actinomycetota bacterium]
MVEGTEQREPEVIVERIAGSIERARARICPGPVGGAAVVWVDGAPGDDANSLLSRADRALHERKIESRRGRISAVA